MASLRRRQTFEITAEGPDEGLQGLSSDPLSSAHPAAMGLRIPAAIGTGPNTAATPRFLFCLASRAIQQRARIRGLRQGVTLGIDLAIGTPPENVIELLQTTPTFRFPDGNVSWHLVFEPNADAVVQRPPTDTAGWRYLRSDDPAMLYLTFTNGNVIPATGQPVYYFEDLTAYTPPDVRGLQWIPLGGLGNFHDLRFPWNASQAWNSLDIEVVGSGRVSFYASVLQTNPASRVDLPGGTSIGGQPPEVQFILANTPTEGDNGVAYWRIFGAMIFEDEDAGAT